MSKKSPTGPTERTPKPEYVIARSQFTWGSVEIRSHSIFDGIIRKESPDERECYLGVPLESQTTNPNQPYSLAYQSAKYYVFDILDDQPPSRKITSRLKKNNKPQNANNNEGKEGSCVI